MKTKLNKLVVALIALITFAGFAKPVQAAEAAVLESAPLTEQYITARVEDRWFARIDEQSGSPTPSPVQLNDEDLIALALQRGDVNPGYQTYKVINRFFFAETQTHYAQVFAYNKTTEETVAIRELKIPRGELPENFDTLGEGEKHTLIIAWGRSKGLVNTADF
jgi:hypothetical protein